MKRLLNQGERLQPGDVVTRDGEEHTVTEVYPNGHAWLGDEILDPVVADGMIVHREESE